MWEEDLYKLYRVEPGESEREMERVLYILSITRRQTLNTCRYETRG